MPELTRSNFRRNRYLPAAGIRRAKATDLMLGRVPMDMSVRQQARKPPRPHNQAEEFESGTSGRSTDRAALKLQQNGGSGRGYGRNQPEPEANADMDEISLRSSNLNQSRSSRVAESNRYSRYLDPEDVEVQVEEDLDMNQTK